MSEAKTYTARNVRERYDNQRVGTAPQNWVRSLLRKFPDSVEIYKVQMSPYRWEPQHTRQQNRIDEYKEENGHGLGPISPDDFAEKMDALDFDCSVRLNERDDGRQPVRCRGGIATYKILLDTDTVEWVE